MTPPRKPATAEQRALLARLAAHDGHHVPISTALSDLVTMRNALDDADGRVGWTREERAGLDRMSGELRAVQASVEARLDAITEEVRQTRRALDATGWDGPP